ncbi:hypothetical protein OU798_12380 [Prolixibacteraceae bacterium Z1-6]|uniref:Uncharacterized protein n=1 Tax=Draconibacterium aestuarii TaxID=2998507 RepID=A0A9X3F5V1_9BACT|nr:hypothetical protein [Prolixibacteraceae bacterium Z1-6]
MNNRFAHIITTVLLGIILVALTVEKSAAQITVHECDTMTFSVTSRPNIPETHFVWGIYTASDQPKDVLDPAGTLDPALYFVDGMYASGEGRTVKVTGLAPGKYYVRIHVWDEVSCTDNIEMYVMTVLESELVMEMYADSVCIGEPTNVYIRFTGRGPYEITYTVGDELTPSVVNLNGTEVDPEITIPINQPLPVGETTFWVIKVEDNCKAYEYTGDERPSTGIVIYPKPTQSRIYLKDD